MPKKSIRESRRGNRSKGKSNAKEMCFNDGDRKICITRADLLKFDNAPDPSGPVRIEDDTGLSKTKVNAIWNNYRKLCENFGIKHDWND